MRWKAPLACSQLALLMGLLAGSPVAARELYRFTGGADGASPSSGLIADASHSLYGVTTYGGTAVTGFGPVGVVYKLVPPATPGGAWTETVLHSFPATLDDGHYPNGNLLLGPTGTLYGATLSGGVSGSRGCISVTCGIVFSLTPNASGTWDETILHLFQSSDGDYPNGSLVMDKAGALYGTAQGGGPTLNGVVFKITPPAPGTTTWTEQTLLAFDGSGKGDFPADSLTMDNAGNLYGTTSGGGDCYCGLIWELSPPAGGAGPWTETILHQFADSGVPAQGGYNPWGTVTLASDGSLFGTTRFGGSATCTAPCGNGVAFRLRPPAPGRTAWRYEVLHVFGPPPDGAQPESALTLGSGGNVYGTTTVGGVNNTGTVFELARPHGSITTWTETILDAPKGVLGLPSNAPLLIGPHHTLYGTTSSSTPGAGLVLRVSPSTVGAATGRSGNSPR